MRRQGGVSGGAHAVGEAWPVYVVAGACCRSVFSSLVLKVQGESTYYNRLHLAVGHRWRYSSLCGVNFHIFLCPTSISRCRYKVSYCWYNPACKILAVQSPIVLDH